VFPYLGEREDLVLFVAVENELAKDDTLFLDSAISFTDAKRITDRAALCQWSYNPLSMMELPVQGVAILRCVFPILREYLYICWRILQIHMNFTILCLLLVYICMRVRLSDEFWTYRRRI